MDSLGMISGWNDISLNADAVYQSIEPRDGFMFVVDNIRLGVPRRFSYVMTYAGTSSIRIKLDDRNNDPYKDIVVYPVDSCARYLWTYINTASSTQRYRRYTKAFTNLEDRLNNYHNANANNSQSFISGITNSIE